MNFQSFFEALPGAYLVLRTDDPAFTITAASEGYLRVSGRRREDLIGRGAFQVFPDGPNASTCSSAENVRASFRRVLQTGAPHQLPAYRYDVEKPEGGGFEERYWTSLNTPVLGENGSVEHILHSVEDITAQTRAEHRVDAMQQLIRESEERLQSGIAGAQKAESALIRQWHTFDTALSHVPDFIYIFDCEGRFTYINRALLALWGRSHEHAVGKNFFDLDYPPELADRLQRQIAQVIETKSPVRDQTPFTAPTGQTGYYEYIFVPVFDKNGEVDAVAGSTRDITDRKRIEEELAASKARLQQIFAQAPVAIIVLRGPDFVVELANPFYEALLQGRSLAGRPFFSVVPELQQDVWDVFHRVVSTGEPYTAHEWHIPYDFDQDGVREDHWFNVAYHPLREADNSVSGMVAVCREVTAQVHARQELERVNRDLEEFAFVAGHDLQEPLRMTSIYSHLILKSLPDADSKLNEYGEFVRQGVARMEMLLRDLLTFSRTVHVDNLPLGEADLSDSLAEAVGVLKGSIEKTGANIVASPLPTVQGDAGQLAHVFQNLIANSLKYRQPNLAPEVFISAQTRDHECVVSVRDNGIGFQQQYAQQIFGLFKRLHKDAYPGTGLGLAICKRMIERYGGRIWAESTPGKGATFFFSLPIQNRPT